MGILEDFANEQPLNIDETFPQQKVKSGIPKAAARNEAALSALLEPGANVEETYRLLFSDEQEGGTEFSKRKKERILAGYRDSDSRVAMDILADPSLSIEQKQSAVAVMQEHQPSLAEIYKVKTSAKPVNSSNAETQKVVDTSINYLEQEMRYRGEAQNIMNGAIAKMDGSFAEMERNALEYLVPLGMTSQALGTLQKAQKSLGLTPSGLDKFVVSASKAKIVKHLESLPADERIKAIKIVTEAITNSSGIILKDKNDLEAINLLQQVGEAGEYGTGSRIADSLFQVLDIVGAGFLARTAVSKAAKMFKPTTAITPPAPLAPLQLATGANPEVARGMYQSAVSNSSDELAEAVSGTSRTDMVLHIEGVQHLDDTVEAKLVSPSGDQVYQEEIKKAIKQGGYQWNAGEVDLAVQETRAAIKEAVSPSTWDNYTQIRRDGDRIAVRTFYGNAESGFLDAEQALEKAKYHFREFEVAEADMKVYARTADGEYAPVNLADVKGRDGDYIIGMDWKQSIDPSSLENITVKRNWLDSIPFMRSQYWGSASRQILDASSMLPKNITGGMENAVDYSTHLDKHLIGIVDEYAGVVKRLDKGQQASLGQAIKDSNFNQIEYSDVTLMTQYGLNSDAISAMKTWRRGWDAQHYLSNLTNIKSMRNSGYQILEHQNAKLFGKPISKNSNLGKVYDPDTDTVRLFTSKEVDDLYDNGGSFAKLKSPEQIQGQGVTHFAVTNKQGNYLRALNDTDQVINKLPGYYKLYYKSPRFVVQNMKDANGVAYEQAIAVAGDWKEAEQFLGNMARRAGVAPEEFGRVRGDVKRVIPGSDEDWQLSSTAGVVNQRHRGKLLQNSGSPVHLGQSDFIVDPLESFVRSAANIANKVALQDNIDLAKKRLMTQFKSVMPVDGSYPNSWSQIGRKGDEFSKESRDARTLWDYIDQQENSILNQLDETIKVGLMAISDAAGKAGHIKTEKVAGAASRVGITSSINSAIHQFLIKYNPLRQWIIQPMQSTQLFAYDPIASFMTTKTLGELAALEVKKMKNVALTAKEKELDSFIRDWGGFAGVDRQVMVDGPIRDLSKSSNAVARAAGKVSDLVGKVGFDSAEKTNLLAHLLTVRNKFIRLGEDVSKPEVIDEIRAETRALTLSMNTAGDMPYNKSAAALFVKFLQIPHKGLMKVTTNRRLEGTLNPLSSNFYKGNNVKARIAAWDALLYGVPMTAVAEWMGRDVLSDNPKIREAQQFGYLTYAYNEVWRQVYEVDPKINLQSMGPYETEGWRKLWHTMMEDGFYKVLASGPAGSMVMGGNPRVANAFQKMGSWMGVNKYRDNPATFMESLTEFAKIAGGVNNAVNYSIIVNTHDELSKSGVKIREGVDNWVALHELFGMQTTPEAAKFSTLDTIRKDTQSKKDQIKADVQYMMKLSKDRYEQDTSNPEAIIRIITMFNKAYEKDPVGLSYAHKEFLQLSQGQDAWFVNAMLGYAGIVSEDKMMSVLKRSGMSEEEIQKFMPVIQSLKDAKEMEKLNEYERQANQ